MTAPKFEISPQEDPRRLRLAALRRCSGDLRDIADKLAAWGYDTTLINAAAHQVHCDACEIQDELTKEDPK